MTRHFYIMDFRFADRISCGKLFYFVFWYFIYFLIDEIFIVKLPEKAFAQIFFLFFMYPG